MRRLTGGRGGAVEEIILVASSDNEYQAYDLAADRWERMQLALAMQAQAAR